MTTERPNSRIADLVVQPGFGGPGRSIEGAWRLPTVGLDPMPAGVSADGSTIVLVEDRPEGAAAAGPSAVRDRRALPPDAEPRIVELPGVFDFDTLSPDGSILYVAEHVPGPLAGRYQVRAIDTATGVMRAEIIVDKRNIDEAMAGWPIDQELRPDGVVLTLYRGVRAPIHPRPAQSPMRGRSASTCRRAAWTTPRRPPTGVSSRPPTDDLASRSTPPSG